MINLYNDGADMNGIIEASKNKNIKGFTTNPTLMKQAGVKDYTKFSKEIIKYLSENRPDTTLSLEVFADDYSTIVNQAVKIDSWGKEYNYPVYVKIPVMYTDGESTEDLIRTLTHDHDIKVNVTAVFTMKQIIKIMSSLNTDLSAIVSIFAGRIADAGQDPERIITFAKDIRNVMTIGNRWKILWASSREAYNYIQAEKSGCDIITMTPDLIKKVNAFGKDLHEFSLDTCKMFYNDAKTSEFNI